MYLNILPAIQSFIVILQRFLHIAVFLFFFLSYLLPDASSKGMFWDEGYHIPSAQKYLKGVMFMAPHPPLGKMIIALGEGASGINSAIDKTVLTEKTYLINKKAPTGISYEGYRFPSAIMMVFALLFFYGILRRIIESNWLAALFSGIVLFDNALVIHTRAAMLEGIQFFFLLGAVYYFVRIVTAHVKFQHAIQLKHYALLSVLIGLTIMVKVNGAISLLLLAMLFSVEQWTFLRKKRFRAIARRLLLAIPCALAPMLATFFTIFYIHIGLGTRIVNDQIYKASPEYLAQIQKGKTWSLTTFALGMRDNWKYMSEYSKGVPRQGKNGSHAIEWIIGKKPIRYRWDKQTANGETLIAYKYLIPNPLVWFSVLAGMVLSSALIIGHFIFRLSIRHETFFLWICVFTGLYISYMIAISLIQRVMYLYHYLIPLLFGTINLALLVTYFYKNQSAVFQRNAKMLLTLFLFAVIATFIFFAPFTYGSFLTQQEFEMRNWLNYWDLKAIRY